jgi:hypothetical protein
MHFGQRRMREFLNAQVRFVASKLVIFLGGLLIIGDGTCQVVQAPQGGIGSRLVAGTLLSAGCGC